MTALAAAACGSSSAVDPCESTACSTGLQCVAGKCVPLAASDAGLTDSGASDTGGGAKDTGATDSSSGLDVSMPEDAGLSEPIECYKADLPWTNTQQSFVIPPGARWMHVKAWGGGANQEQTCPGGAGGYTEASFEVTPGTELIFIVGGPGHASDEVGQMLLGFGQTGGSGLSGVFSGPGLVKAGEFDKAWLIAGGGGGAGVMSGGGPCISGIPGNHPEAGGMPTMMGGVGLDDNVNGGGGGYRGGKGGAKGQHGVGGTGYVDTARAADSQMAHANTGDPAPPNTADPDYKDNAGAFEKPGLVVVKFTCDKPVLQPPK